MQSFFYKMQGEESAGQPLQLEDIIIVVKSPMQKTILQQFGSKGVYIDSTRGTTGYDSNLTTLMVINKFGSGFQMTWCMSNDKDIAFMTVFHNKVKGKSGKITAN